MDLSKLPRLSNSPKADTADSNPPLPAEPRQGAQLAYEPRYDVPVNGVWEAGLSVAVGGLLLFMYPRFLQWVSSRLFHTTFNEFTMPDGQIVPYPQVPEFWMDLGPVLFGIILILDGGVLVLARHRVLILIAFGLTALTTAYNLVYVVSSFASRGIAPVSFLATVFGCYMLATQWRLIRSHKQQSTLE